MLSGTGNLFSKFDTAMGQNRTVVTVFGGGVAGLSAAHELILRGYYVQLIEPRESNLTEYACEVGGLAASQFSRVKATRRIHPYFFTEPDGSIEHEFGEWNYWDSPPVGADYLKELGEPIMQRGQDFLPNGEDGTQPQDPAREDGAKTDPDSQAIIKQLRSLKLRPTQRLTPFPERVVFEHAGANSDNYVPGLKDDMGTENSEKIGLVAAKILLAIHRYHDDLRRELRALYEEFIWDRSSCSWKRRDEKSPSVAHKDPFAHLSAEVILRETFLLEIKGHHGTDDIDLPEKAWNRASQVKLTLLDILSSELKKLEASSPTEDEQKDAAKRVEGIRYPSDLLLGDVAVAYYKTWKALNFFQKTEKKIKLYLRGYLIVMIEPSDERPPIYEDWSGLYKKEEPEWFKNARLRFNRVEFSVVEHAMPGEHGYRFFPSFYKNLFSTMRRTPVMEGKHASYRTAFDNLSEPPAAELARTGGVGMQPSPKRPGGTGEHLKVVMKEAMAYLGATEKDQYKAQNRFIKYMTSSQARRRKYEDISWLEFVDGFREMEEVADPQGAAECPTSYSAKYEELLRRLPQALVSMSAAESDARSFGSASIQNLKDFAGLSDEMDMMLNGPTSSTWLYPWKQYLKTQGVRFFVGHIDKLEMHGDELVPVLGGPQRGPNPGKPRSERPGHTLITAQGASPPGNVDDPDTVDYFVSTLPFEVITSLLWSGRKEDDIKFCGDMAKLLYFVDHKAWPYGGDYDPFHPKREASGRPQKRFEFPLRDFNGIQFYFDKNVQIGGSYVYYVDAPWGLTALAQVYLWHQRPSPDKGFLGELSVDIGTLYEPGIEPYTATAWNSTPHGIANGVWSQIHASLPTQTQKVAPAPSFYYIDSAIEFKEVEFEGIKLNCTPFIVQLPSQFRLLPGTIVIDQPDKYQHNEFLYPTRSNFDSFEAIHYNISHQRWILAGSCMPTHTRLFTMEGANESARHAVNALLHDKLTNDPADGDEQGDKEKDLPGTYCDVYNMEMDEFPEFNFARSLDRELMAQGLPHVLDILDTFEMLDELPDKVAQKSKAEKLGMVLKSAVSLNQEAAGDSALVQRIRRGEENMDQYTKLAKGLFDWIKSKSDKD